MLQRQKSSGFYVVGPNMLLVERVFRGHYFLAILILLMCMFLSWSSKTTRWFRVLSGQPLCVHPEVSQSVNDKRNGSCYETFAHLRFKPSHLHKAIIHIEHLRLELEGGIAFIFLLELVWAQELIWLYLSIFCPLAQASYVLLIFMLQLPYILGEKQKKKNPRGTELTVICQWEAKMTQQHMSQIPVTNPGHSPAKRFNWRAPWVRGEGSLILSS